MRSLFLLFALAAAVQLPASLRGQSDDGELKIPPAPVPKLRNTGRSAQDFTPAGWTVEVQQTGDLNADGKPDLAFVLHETSKALVVHNKNGFGVDELDTNPRILGIAFAKPDGSYTLAAQNSKLIPRWTEPNMEDYFEEGGMEIKHGALAVSLHTFASAGTWYTGDTTFTFRWQHGRFELIGYEDDSIHRATLEETITSVNYSISVKEVSRGGEHGPTKVTRKQLPRKPLLTLEQMPGGFDFEAP